MPWPHLYVRSQLNAQVFTTVFEDKFYKGKIQIKLRYLGLVLIQQDYVVMRGVEGKEHTQSLIVECAVCVWCFFIRTRRNLWKLLLLHGVFLSFFHMLLNKEKSIEH